MHVQVRSAFSIQTLAEPTDARVLTFTKLSIASSSRLIAPHLGLEQPDVQADGVLERRARALRRTSAHADPVLEREVDRLRTVKALPNAHSTLRELSATATGSLSSDYAAAKTCNCSLVSDAPNPTATDAKRREAS